MSTHRTEVSFSIFIIRYEVAGHNDDGFGCSRSRHRNGGDTYVGLKNIKGLGDVLVSAVLVHALVEMALDGGLEITAFYVAGDANSQLSHED